MDASIDFSGVLKGSIADGGGSGGGDTVIITPLVTSGTKIADVSVNGVEKDLYCPTPPAPTEVDITPVVTSGTKIADVSIGGVEKDLYTPDYGADITALDGRLDTAEGNITNLAGRMTEAETDITALGIECDAIATDLAAPYDEEETYSVGDYCTHDKVLYKCNTDISTSEEWNVSHWDAVKVTEDITEINQSLSHLDGLAVYRQVIPTGDTASFIANDSMQIIKLESNIIASQDLHGYNEPWAGGAGKNKFPIATASSSGAQNIFSSQPVSLNANTNYILSFDTNNPLTRTMSVSFNAGGTQVRGVDIPAGTSIVGISFTQNVDNVDWYVREAADLYNIMIEEGGQKTDFTPYSNICPISGFIDIDVSLSPTLDPQDATIYTTNFVDSGSPLTVYGGYIDVISGSLTVTDANIASYAGETLPSTWISDRDVYTSGGTPTTGAQVVYKLTSALSYQLTAQQINDLVGQNYIWSDTGSIKEVGYLDILHLS